MAEAKRKAYKDWFDKEAAKALSVQLAAVDKNFDTKTFVKQCSRGLSALEFNARVKKFADAMAASLPNEYPKAIAIIQKSLPPELPDCDSVTDGWLQWPVGQFIADYGLEHFDESMECMVELTKRLTSEFAVRPFVERYPDQTFEYFYKCMKDANPHVRRWCSEGARTRLPWGGNLKELIADPSPIVPVLEALKDDDEIYVRKSVANNLNDLAKDHPTLVIEICQRWSKDSNEGRDWIIRHGLRTLIKQGDSRALKISGFIAPINVKSTLCLDKHLIKTGEIVELQVSLGNESGKKQKLLLDYIVKFKGKSDQSRNKVFKWKSLELAAGETLHLSKRHPMKQTSVRALYPGKHSVQLQLNGQLMDEAEFVLKIS